MSGWRTVAVIMGRDLAARRRATLIATGVIAGLAVAGILVAALATEGSTRPLRGDDADKIVGYLGVITLMFGLVFTGQVITEGVAEEKRSRVVEVVLGAVSPRRLLLGKAAAIGLIGLLEVMVLCAAVAVAGRVLDVFPLPEATMGALAAVLGFFVLGFAFYAAVYAAAGAMVAPHENPANGAILVNLVVMVGYIGGFISLNEGGGMFLRVFSLLPPTAPLTMPLRVVLQDVAAWEVALSAALLLAAAWGVIVLAGRL
ncbi:MAG: ABC transporter permease, partial [Acidimicrobiia bacterium]|nr:ABC transporter permease [Acidimicrobiia bacterium]